MKHLHGCHESPHAHHVVLRLANFFGLVVHSVELADFVGVTDGFEEGLDRCSVAWHLEVGLLNAQLRKGRREKQVNCLGLVSIVRIISH